MRPHRSLNVSSNVDELILRLERVQADSARRWGTLTPHEMLCHLSDSFLGVMGERPVSAVDTWWSRNVIKWIAIHTSLPWPEGVPTRPEVDPKRGGTRPIEFERDRAKTIELLRRFVRPDTNRAPHPVFGVMTRDEWMLWGYGHCDHHLRQFGQ